MERMIIKHLIGSKANQVEEFALKHHTELTFGRDTSATIQFDPDRDDLVGRQHARIDRDRNDNEIFLLTDLNSRNGTFLNDKKIDGTIRLRPGDIVQFGPGGPKFQFDVEPRPKNATKPTRVVETGRQSPPTRVADNSAIRSTAGSGGSNSVDTKPQTKASVGKATVERMISHNVAETRQQERSNFAKIGGAAAIAVLLLFGVVIGGGFLYTSWQSGKTADEIARAKIDAEQKAKEAEEATRKLKEGIDKDKASAPKAAAEIAEKYGKTVVYITGTWQLTNNQTKSQIYHQFMPNSLEALGRFFKKNFGKGPIIPGGPNAIPLYSQVGNAYEPILTDSKTALSVPIGGNYSGSGFIVTNDGFILTNTHVAAPWKARHSFPQGYPIGVLFTSDGQIKSGVRPPSDWVPENTKQTGPQFQGTFDGVGKLLVQLPGDDTPIKAEFRRASKRHDVSLIELSLPGNLTKVEMNDKYEKLRKGDGLVVMGYPGTAPVVYGEIRSQNILNPETKYSVIPDPTVTTTSIGNIVKGNATVDAEGEGKRMSMVGDSIRFAQGLTGSGNSGGPVFDMQGKVVGILFAGDQQSSFAVPIKYGLRLFPSNQ